MRHPLLELNDELTTFIPNDVETGCYPLDMHATENEKSNKIKVITAPNASGKTVYLKQAALLVYMSMIGGYVAADSADIGDFDRIYTRINSNDSIELQMSTFAIDLSQIADAVNGATDKSLVIIDEFGKGSDANDAQILIAAIIRYWINEVHHPHVYLSTHFYEMFDFAGKLFGENNRKIEYLTFDYVYEDEDLEKKAQTSNSFSKIGDQLLIFMYKLKKGITISSFALNIARKEGLLESVLQKASNIIEIIKESCKSDRTDSMKELNTKMINLLANLDESKETVEQLVQYSFNILFCLILFIPVYLP